MICNITNKQKYSESRPTYALALLDSLDKLESLESLDLLEIRKTSLTDLLTDNLKSRDASASKKKNMSTQKRVSRVV